MSLQGYCRSASSLVAFIISCRSKVVKVIIKLSRAIFLPQGLRCDTYTISDQRWKWFPVMVNQGKVVDSTTDFLYNSCKSVLVRPCSISFFAHDNLSDLWTFQKGAGVITTAPIQAKHWGEASFVRDNRVLSRIFKGVLYCVHHAYNKKKTTTLVNAKKFTWRKDHGLRWNNDIRWHNQSSRLNNHTAFFRPSDVTLKKCPIWWQVYTQPLLPWLQDSTGCTNRCTYLWCHCYYNNRRYLISFRDLHCDFRC